MENKIEITFEKDFALAIFGERADDEQIQLSPEGAAYIRGGISQLPYFQKKCILSRFKDKKTLEEVAKMYKVTKQYARESEAKVFRRFRNPNFSRELRTYVEWVKTE